MQLEFALAISGPDYYQLTCAGQGGDEFEWENNAEMAGGQCGQSGKTMQTERKFANSTLCPPPQTLEICELSMGFGRAKWAQLQLMTNMFQET